MRSKSTLCSAFAGAILALCLGTASVFATVNVTVQPSSQVALVGTNATYTAFVSASGGETITGYSWRTSTNGQAPFTIIPGATGSSYTINNVQTTNGGFYYVAVTYNSGTNIGLVIVSTAATLVVHDQARIVGQPQSLSRIAGQTASFTVVALGQTLSYQWRFNGANLADDGRISGSATATLTIPNLVGPDAGSYDVVVTNIYAAVTSQVATLQVLVPPSIVVPPQNLGVVIGSNAIFTVTAAGDTPFGYQWQKNGANLSNSGRFNGVQTDTLTITGARTNEAGDYSVIVTNPVGAITSVVATLSVYFPPVITSPTAATYQQGYFFSFTNTATGSAPITFGADVLPTGLTLDPASGILSGIPAVFGVFDITIFATNPATLVSTNAALNATNLLILMLISDVPGITSPLTAAGKQGQPFTYSILASNTPTLFSAVGLPPGLSLDTNGVISGSPLVYGALPVAIGASNLYGGDLQTLILNIDSSVPVITNVLSATGIQGSSFSFSITASNPVVSFASTGLPPGINLNPATGQIFGSSILSGTFPVNISAINQFGSDTRILTLNLASAVPVITSVLVTNAAEEQPFTYTITATNALNSSNYFAAWGLPLGLNLVNNTNITGAPLYGGTFNILLAAENAYGTVTNTLVLNVSYVTNTSIDISTNSVSAAFSAPYLIDFSFTLEDQDGNAVVRPPSDFQLTCFENGVPVPSETQPILLRGVHKQFKGFLVLDYTYSMLASPGAISNMQYSAELLINQEPVTAQFGVYEFNADYETPMLVTNFTSDKTVLAGAIEGIQTNFVKGDYAGTRAFDAMYAALGQFVGTNTDESRYLIVMSDGNDDSSLLDTNANPVAMITGLAQTNNVHIYCVGFGPDINTNVLQQLATDTQGRYYEAATTADLPVKFAQIAKDIDGQYLVRWATLNRTSTPFQPSFELTLDGLTADFNTNIVMTNYMTYTTNMVGGSNVVTTNMVSTNVIQFPYVATDYAGPVKVGGMRLVPDADVGPQTVRLRATYVPRFIREIRINYRANYGCTPVLASTGPGEFFNTWTMTQTNDGVGGQWLTLLSPNPDDLLTSLPYGIMGDLVTFQFHFPEKLATNTVFSMFLVDTNIYTNMLPGGQSFVLSNATSFVTLLPPPPAHGTPVPWLNAYGFTNNLDAAELTDPNGTGFMVWQDYLAGLNPRDPNSRFDVQPIGPPQPGQPVPITFSTVVGRTYRVDTATSLGVWYTLQDYITGTGRNVTVFDNRDLSGVAQVFYRVAVY